MGDWMDHRLHRGLYMIVMSTWRSTQFRFDTIKLIKITHYLSLILSSLIIRVKSFFIVDHIWEDFRLIALTSAMIRRMRHNLEKFKWCNLKQKRKRNKVEPNRRWFLSIFLRLSHIIGDKLFRDVIIIMNFAE